MGINLSLGENGILIKASTAKEEHKIAQYEEVLNLIITEEVTERKVGTKEETMIDSLKVKIDSKDWVDKTTKESGEVGIEEQYLIVQSKEGYEFIIEVNNEKETARIIQGNKTPGKKYTITYDPNGGSGDKKTDEVRRGFSKILEKNTFTKEDCEFVKWNTKADGTGTDYEDLSTINTSGDIILYAIWKENPITPAIIKKNPGNFYGAVVSNYSAKTLNGKDYNKAVANWKIFYADSSNIYLIADDYIHYDYCPSSKTKKIYKNTDYRLSFNNVISDYPNGSAHITDARIKALNNDYFNTKKYTSTNNNMKAVVYMLDTGVWSGYAGDKADYAIGGPTIEMLMNSYSQKHKVDYKAKAMSSTGYQVSKDGGANWANNYGKVLDSSDDLYVISSTDKAKAMYLASPSAYDDTKRLVNTDYSGSVSNVPYDNGNHGLRPLVCLNDTVRLEKVSDGKYRIME